MYYSAIGILAALILLIENQDILLNRSGAFEMPAWKVYRRFVFAVLFYYAVDILWGLLEAHKLQLPLFIATTAYFISIAVGTLFWTQYMVVYLDEKGRFSRFLLYAGYIICGGVTALAAANIFAPVLFVLDDGCVYRPLPGRSAILAAEILLLLLISVYAFSSYLRERGVAGKKLRYRTLTCFGLIMAALLFAQLRFPFLPFYAVAYMLGTCLLRAVVIGNEKEEYRRELMEHIQREHATTKEAYEKARSTGTIYSHIAQAVAGSYTNLYYVDLNTEEFIEYRTDGEGKLVEARRGVQFFEALRADAEQRVHSYDRDALLQAMNRQTLLDTLRRDNSFIMTYRLLRGSIPVYATMNVSRARGDDRFIIIGVTDVDDQVKQQRSAKRLQEEQIAYSRISVLAGDYICVYVVVPETGHYREFSSNKDFESFGVPEEGEDFFASSRERGRSLVHPDDLDRYLSLFTMENVLAEVKRSGIFAMTYRLTVSGKPTHVQLKAAMLTEKGGPRLIVGLSNVEAQIQQEREYEARLAQAQSKATVDELTGAKNRHAFATAKEQMDRLIAAHTQPDFAVVVLDVNDLKKVNDTQGHQAGDLYIQNACNLICETFKHSPVFRVGGDEFAVIAQGRDYENIGTLVGQVNGHNAKARRTGGIVIACGMSQYNGDANIDAVFERADQSMYDNKRALKENP